MAWMIASPWSSTTTPTSRGWPVREGTDEHCDRGVVGFECDSVVAVGVRHVVVVDAVLAGARLDVHIRSLRRAGRIVNMC